jgi:Protein of unknown function (DUF1703)./Predicted AAA-ATPase.
MKLLPIGIQTFRDIIEGGFYYVDKTPFIPKLTSKYYFLSRPRRFGKSLFLDTLKEAFSGNKELFKGLYLYDNWNWEKRYPVITINFTSGVMSSSQLLKKNIHHILETNAKRYELNLEEKEVINIKFEELITKIYQKHNMPVVVLVDEYDKPILDAIENIEVARENREILKDFYSVLKGMDPYLKLVFLTGVSRFSKVSIFSGLNQLQDITLNEEFSTVCGYTQSELESVFEDRLKDFDKEKIKVWYNGYSWLGESVYNPFDILLLFSEKRFRAFWFETGTPTFLIKMFMKNRYYLPELENLEVGEEILSNLDVDNIRVENLLFQAGYLTIKEYKEKYGIYTLSYPNLEVRKSFTSYFLTYIIEDISAKYKTDIGLIEAFENKQVEKLKNILHRFFASIPHDWHRKNDIDSYEGFYASIVYALFNGAGLNVIAEDNTNKGQIDLSVFNQDSIYIIEFKAVEDKEERKALKQIKEKRYYEKYIGKYQEIYLIGIEFSKKDKNIVGFEWEKV